MALAGRELIQQLKSLQELLIVFYYNCVKKPVKNESALVFTTKDVKNFKNI